MKTVTSDRVLQGLVKMFTTHGLPATLTSDNGPQFASQELKDYLRQNGIVQRRVTPLWPQANGEVERQNKSFLKLTRALAQAERRIGSRKYSPT